MSKGNRNNKACGEISYTGSIRLPSGWGSVVLSGGRALSVEWHELEETVGERIAEKYPGAKKISWDSSPEGKFLSGYSKGEVPLPEDISSLFIAWEMTTEFTRKVLQATAEIPYGCTSTYKDIAERIGNPRAARAVGAALSRNPWPIIIPCHRVVGNGGNLVGFGKGLAVKKALLEFEESNSRGNRVAQ